MIFRRFSILTTLRISLILLNGFIIASIFGDDRLFFNQIILALILIVQVYELIRFVNVTNRELTKFFQAVKQSDFTINFTKDTLGRSYAGLFESMRSLLDAYKKVKIEKEAQFHLLQQIIAHVPTGIIVIAEKDDIILLNESAKKILKIPQIKSWKALQAKLPKFTALILQFPSNGRFLVETEVEKDIRTLSLDLSRFTLLEQDYELITFADIKSEIEQKEIEAWHRLIRILTHEIMNSVTPISSLTETMQGMLAKPDLSPKTKDEITDQTISDLLFSLKTIQKRSDGLLNFVEDYRRLTRVPKPELEDTIIQELFANVLQLMSAELKAKNISSTIKITPPEYAFKLDRSLIEQVLINLVKNSIQALSKTKNPSIQLQSRSTQNSNLIEVIDNGSGIDQNDINDIWVPFYTTKESGSGIGLSLTKQVMKLHHGNIAVQSMPNKATIFSLEFYK